MKKFKLWMAAVMVAIGFAIPAITPVAVHASPLLNLPLLGLDGHGGGGGITEQQAKALVAFMCQCEVD